MVYVEIAFHLYVLLPMSNLRQIFIKFSIGVLCSSYLTNMIFF